LETENRRRVKRARDIMSSPAITVTPDTQIQELARILRENQISGVPVVEESGRVLGTITELDMIARNAPLKQPRYLPVLSGVIPFGQSYEEYKEQMRQILATNAGELMSDDPPVIVAPDTELDRLFELMQNPMIGLLAVVEQGRLVGVISRTDLMQLVEDLELDLAEWEDDDGA
jgi:CBS domain-containing protein